MTDTTTQPKMTLEDLLIRCTDYDDMSLSMDASELKMLKQHISLLEAERQRADAAEGELRSEVMKNLLTTDCMRKAHRKIAEMEGEQEPIAYLTRHMGCRAPDDCEEYLEVSDKDGVSGNGEPAIPVFTAPQKPVVWLGDIAIHDDLHEVGALVSYDDVVAAIESAGGIVKDGE